MPTQQRHGLSSAATRADASGLHGKTVVITGGAKGIGLCMVSAFAAAGADVVAADRDRQALDALRSQRPEVRTILADVSTAEGADATIAAADGRLDVLCNNAGVVEPLLFADELPDDVWAEVLSVNLTAPFLLCTRALPIMLAQGSGTIINSASTAGLRAGRGGAAYTASKSALVGLSHSIAVTYADRGVRCNAICPGPIETDIIASLELSPRASRLLTRDAEKPERGSPDEVAALAVFLAGDGGARVNGVALPIDGGWIAY